jgi:hypothetical protein
VIAALLVVGGALYLASAAARGGSETSAAVVPRDRDCRGGENASLAHSTGEMVLIPAGDFEFGENKQRVPLPAFYIDKTEVSNAAYAEFCKASGRPLPDGFPGDKPDYPGGQRDHSGRPRLRQMGRQASAHRQGMGESRPRRGWPRLSLGQSSRCLRAPTWARAPGAAGERPCRWRQPLRRCANGGQRVGVLIEQLSQPSEEAMENFRIQLKPAPRADEPWYQIRGESYDDPLAQNVIWDSTTVPARWKAPEHRLPLRQRRPPVAPTITMDRPPPHATSFTKSCAICGRAWSRCITPRCRRRSITSICTRRHGAAARHSFPRIADEARARWTPNWKSFRKPSIAELS